ncbi:hypothetical protein [Planococcus sp. CAU13]|uniref:hypothetical protein n=1 Tax=Planococcus sp. CAU13 TaxID=1541197 RepID=UPI00052FED7F|nr:hypothetical protein [Planococcus sp. CAU13]
MVRITDFVSLQVNNQVQNDAIEYAGRSLNYTYNRMGYNDDENRLKRIMVGIVIEKVYENYLITSGATFSTKGRTHWRNKDVAEFYMNNRIIDIKGYHVYPHFTRDFPNWFLDVEGLVPYGQLKKGASSSAYLQAFLVSQKQNTSAVKKFVAVLPKGWSDNWNFAANVSLNFNHNYGPIAPLTLFGEGGTISISDTNESIIFSNGSYTTNNLFSSIQFLSSDVKPTTDITISVNNFNIKIEKEQWFDVWLENPEVTFAAWGNYSDYKFKGEYLKIGSKTQVYTGGTKTGNMSVMIRNLRALNTL